MERETKIWVSVIIPTYNSEATLERTLQSLVNQSIGRDKIEILIVDAGSTDRTRQIAEEYGAVILNNKKKLPEIAKQIGFINAKGYYGMFLDSDEIMGSMESFARRIAVMEKHPEIKNFVSAGMICQKGERALIRYTNHFADPFSFFVYRYNGRNRCEDLPKTYKHHWEQDALIMEFEEQDVLPLFDAAGNMFEMECARKLYKESAIRENFIATVFDSMVYETKVAAVLKDDFVIHIPRMRMKTYFSKLKWRVKNNAFPDKNKAIGFATRRQKNIRLKIRQYLYVPYCLTILPVLLDTVYLTLKYRDGAFLLHFIFAEYTFVCIAFYMIAKLLHIPVSENKEYGKK